MGWGDGAKEGVWQGPNNSPYGLGNMSAEKRGRNRSDPCKEHETVPGWMTIQWARATWLLAARWGINTG